MGKFDFDFILKELGVKTTRRVAAPGAGTPPGKPNIHGSAKNVPGTQGEHGPAPAPPWQDDGADGQTLIAIEQPAGEAPGADDSATTLGQWLVRSGAATEQQLLAAEQVVGTTPGKRLSDVLIEQGCDGVKVQQGVARTLNLPFVSIDLAKGLEGGFDGKLTQRLGADFCRVQGVLPLRMEGGVAVVGMLHPEDLFVIDEVRRRLGIMVTRSVVIAGFDLRGALEIIDNINHAAASSVDVDALLSEVSESDVQVEKKTDDQADLARLGEESPVIKYVNYIIQTASKDGASDIHIEPGDKKIRVRFRIDGELYEMMQPPPALGPAIVSRLKIMSNMDISERRLPQDGRIRCLVGGRKLDLRVSTLPVSNGEKVVMRILDTKSISVPLDQLGFEPDTLRIWKSQIEAPHGIVLVTGPTGSGKTTTLYASLQQLDKSSMNISTVEDPVEYHLDGITQCQTHEKIGMTFAKALKSLLRQDPDVILLGEIRDLETAVTAVQAALTGHLVLSTLHTNDAPSSITRLVNIGIEPFLVGAALNAVLAQRLVRRLCKECKQQAKPNESLADFLTLQGLPADKAWAANGCDKCRKSGYSGRLGIYELLVIDDQLRDMVARNPNVSELRRLCTDRGMVNLRSDGLKKAVAGHTSVQEVLRITESTI
ncbi:MAG: Flp pilus assembly complex ATPase component TadA [Phycisphaeraceae bacterium]|nr:Flp pilus assembly complex ATPase component TadA [Phycisphaeraceae bacterium]